MRSSPTTLPEGCSGAALAARLLARLRTYGGPPVSLMEVCGTHTVAVARMGLRRLLPTGVRLRSGPGCPVCVTPVEVFDEALALAAEPGVILATYGDALRVPGSVGSLADVRARGADVRVVYGAAEALALARREPRREVVLLGLGFETTAPGVAWAVLQARREGLSNFTVLSAHKALMPALHVLLRDPELAVAGLLCPGHASMVLGSRAYAPLAQTYRVPCAVAGFEPEEVLLGLGCLLDQIARGEARVDNAYPSAVPADGNPTALRVLGQVFELTDSRWRGLGALPGSGYEVAPEYGAYDARRRFLAGRTFPGQEPAGCACAGVLRGRVEPADCPLFGDRCTPHSPVGACMVSSEGACGAQYRFREV